MLCKFCGAEMRDNAPFCGLCGKRVDEAPKPQQTDTPAEASDAFAGSEGHDSGYCAECKAFVYLDAYGRCPDGHAPSSVSHPRLGESMKDGGASAPPPRTRYCYAGFWRRLAAFLLDGLVISAIDAFIWIPITVGRSALGTRTTSLTPVLFGYGATIIVAWLYYALMEGSRWQATLGKMALRLVVADEARQRISFLRATGRYILKALVPWPLHLVAFIVSDSNQAVHDMLLDTYVLERYGPLPAASQHSRDTQAPAA